MSSFRDNVFVVALCLPLAIIVAVQSYSGNPQLEPNPADMVRIGVTAPKEVAWQAAAVWRTAGTGLGCRDWALDEVFFPVFFPKRSLVTLTPEPVTGDRVLTLYRDHYIAQRCQWRFQGLNVWVDRADAGTPPPRESRFPTFPVRTCPEDGRCEMSWAGNDDASKPAFIYCWFSSHGSNYCAFNDQFRGTDLGKAEHILRQDQHEAKVVLVDLEAKHTGGNIRDSPKSVPHK